MHTVLPLTPEVGQFVVNMLHSLNIAHVNLFCLVLPKQMLINFLQHHRCTIQRGQTNIQDTFSCMKAEISTHSLCCNTRERWQELTFWAGYFRLKYSSFKPCKLNWPTGGSFITNSCPLFMKSLLQQGCVVVVWSDLIDNAGNMSAQTNSCRHNLIQI